MQTLAEVIVQWLIKPRSVPVPPVLSLDDVWRNQSHGTFCPASDGGRGATGFARSKSDCHSYLHRGQSYTGLLAPYKRCVFRVCTANTTVHFFLGHLQKLSPDFQENGFCASCHGDWSAQWAEGRQGAEFTSQLCIITQKSSYGKRESVRVENDFQLSE